MPTLDCSAVSESGVTLVEARLASDDRRRVSVTATHDSPVWPPRREGVPAAGWSSDGWTGVVPAGDTVALGYATPGEVADRPLRITESGPPRDDGAATPRDVLRSLGDPRPPRDAVPVDPRAHPTDTETVGGQPTGELEAIESRLDRAERLAGAESVDAARAAVADAGGIEAVRGLAGQLERDRERLAALRARVEKLRSRAAVDVPVDDLSRLV